MKYPGLSATIDGMAKNEVKALRNWVMDLAYIRDGKVTHTDESVILACLLHTKGKGRRSPDMTDVQRIMRDKNLNNNKTERR